MVHHHMRGSKDDFIDRPAEPGADPVPWGYETLGILQVSWRIRGSPRSPSNPSNISNQEGSPPPTVKLANLKRAPN